MNFTRISSIIVFTTILHLSYAPTYDDYTENKQEILKRIKKEDSPSEPGLFSELYRSLSSLSIGTSSRSSANIDLCASDTKDDILLHTCVKIALRRTSSQGEPLEYFFHWTVGDLKCENRNISGTKNSVRMTYRCPSIYTKIQTADGEVKYRLADFFLAQNYKKTAVYVFKTDQEDDQKIDVIGEWTKFDSSLLDHLWKKFYGRMSRTNTFSYYLEENTSTSTNTENIS